MTHPFHPLTGQRLPVLKRRVLGGTPMLQLQVGQDSVSVPEDWTDGAVAPAPAGAGAPAALLTPEALRELLELLAALQPSDGSQQP